MRQFQLSFEDESWHLTDSSTDKLLACFGSNLEALRQAVYKLKHCPGGGTLTIKLSEKIREENSTSLQQLSLQI